MGKRYENLEEALCRELEMLDKKYGGQTAEMSVQDVEKADKLYHALKSAETYHAMADAEEWKEDEEEGESGEGRSYRRRSYGNGDGRYSGGRYSGGRSYRRGRDAMGRFTSREGGSYGRWPMYPGYPMSYEYPAEEWR